MLTLRVPYVKVHAMAKAKKKTRKVCQTAKGRLKKGYRYGKRGVCIKAKKK